MYHHTERKNDLAFSFQITGLFKFPQGNASIKFLWMDIISLHSRRSLIHFKPGACMDFLSIQMYHQVGNKSKVAYYIWLK